MEIGRVHKVVEGSRDSDVEEALSPDCPIARTHEVLIDAHWYWHEALAAYFDPRGFRASVNALIQTLRNVTWVLQSEKHSIPDFDTWYSAQQIRMKDDPVMRWLVDARNASVKRGELKTHSRARVALIFDWAGERLVTHVEVPPLTRTEDIPAAVHFHVPAPVREHALARIDRQWVAETLPDRELLDGLGHCYGVIRHIVEEAHDRLNATYEITHPHERFTVGDDGRLGCMMPTEDQRTLLLNLNTGQVSQPSSTAIEPDQLAMARAAKRYGLDVQPEHNSDPVAFAEYCVTSAKRVLAKDKYHLPFVWLFHPSGLRMIAMPTEDAQQKYFGWDRISREVRRLGATAVVSVAETWLAPADDVARGIPPRLSKQKKEAIDVTVASIDGHSRTYLTIFRRRLGRIVFEPTVEVEGEGIVFLQPVRRVWQEMKSTTAI